MARFGDGLAADADLVRAAERAATAALAPLNGRRPDLAAVFVSGGPPDAVEGALVRAAERCGARANLGCSAPGVIAQGRGVRATNAVAVWCAVLPQVTLRSFALEVMPADDGMAVVGLPERHDDDVVALLLADPWSFPVDGFIAQSNVALPGLPFVGGMAAGVGGRGSTRLLVEGRVVDRGAVGVLLGGPVGASPLVSQGCRPVGPAMTVTAAEDNVVLELAGVPALGKLEEILGGLPPAEQALASQGLHIGVARDEYVEEHGQGDFLIRGIAGAQTARGGLVVGDLVPVGRTVRFQVRDAGAAHDDLTAVLATARAAGSMDTVEGALLFSCNGRMSLFPTIDHDPVTVQSALAATGVAGCFAAGEIGPVGGRNHVHGFTASLLAFGSGSGSDRGTRTG